MRIAVMKRFIKDHVKKVITKRYKITYEKFLSGENRYYIIRRKSPWAGFYANYLYVAGHIVYAIKKGYIPVVDMQNYPTLYNEEGGYLGTNNAWEYYFEQPYGVCVEEAYNSGNYILSDYSTMREYIPYKDGKSYFYIEWKKAYPLLNVLRNNMVLKSTILQEIENFYFENCLGKKVLGVHYRGTDKKVVVKNHFLSAALENYLIKVDECLKENTVDQILLCTDDKEAIKVFSERYPGKVIFSNAFRAEEGDTEGIHLKKSVGREHHNYLLGKEVIIDVMLLAKCQYFVFSHSNVATSVMFLNNREFDKTYFVDD